MFLRYLAKQTFIQGVDLNNTTNKKITDTSNDSLWGDKGNDTFLYSSGDSKDVFFGFENNALLQIKGAFSTSYNKSKKKFISRSAQPQVPSR